MVVGVKDLDMDDSDAYVTEDTVEDYAMVWINIFTVKILFYTSKIVQLSETLLIRTDSNMPIYSALYPDHTWHWLFGLPGGDGGGMTKEDFISTLPRYLQNYKSVYISWGEKLREEWYLSPMKIK